MKFISAFSLVVLASLSVHAQSTSWKITQPTWTESHERQFGEFVASIGMAVEKRNCGKVDDCLRSSANPYYKSDPAGLKYFADCADLPYYLRSYFAWKNGLPMSVISEVKAKPAPSADTNPTNDVRYSSAGNYVTKRYDVLPRVTNGKVVFQNALNILNNTIPDYTFSASYRMPGTNDESLSSDFYPAAISREAIRPGTVIYDPNGHVAIVYRVADDGRIFYIDAHPDNSLTRGMFTPKFVRSKPGQGAGFKNFRPLKMVNAKKDAAGNYYGGQLIASSNSEIPLYGTTQFYGSQPDPNGSWSKGKFVISGQNVNFYDYVRMKLMKGEVHIDPLSDMAQLTDDICVSLKDRVDAVEAARRNGIDKKPHPARLPENIYGTSGEWEDYSSPSRDARLKVAFQDLLSTTKSNIERYNQRDPAIKYNGGNLANDLLVVYAERAKACTFSYTTSAGRTVMMNLEAGRQRLWDMSFDPYHCIELRWGARVEGELASCQDDANKRAWYAAEKWLRYQSERKYDARMDYSLSELKGPLPSAGVASPEDIDIVGYLKSMR
ncbi:hypothetical protein AZI86_15200 [Bdellovibrio bacteriovorus]|uniref:Uncharacterized protein n=1 Tax=Bdellovibrio bacteriovorus TaxID=959 RepID=A0A150WHH3_BDEBC|nr:hypothetical protein [Bdellovibrio bacteriovorus]KYG63064.1 hypothetical protein AZI86_15200 [Bdellovibrio bacteriovorus]